MATPEKKKKGKKSLVEENFIKLSTLGEGTYGIVYKAKDKRTNNIVALKQMRRDEEELGIPSSALREAAVLRSLSGHNNIVALLDVIEEKSQLTLVFEYVETDLKQFINNYDKTKMIHPMVIKNFMYQLLNGIYHCHINRIIHRDLKPHNLLINESQMRLKIGDFGLARRFHIPAKSYTHEVVTLWYRAPEILLSDGGTTYSCPIDIWSIGCIMAELYTKIPLFRGDSEIGQLMAMFRILGTPNDQSWPGIKQFKHYKARFPVWNDALEQAVAPLVPDPHAIQLLRKLLTYSPMKRVSALDAMEEPYFQNYCKEIPKEEAKAKEEAQSSDMKSSN